jgi:hypothetical protein
MITLYAIIGLCISFPFVLIHLGAKPDDTPISPLQHLTAAVANFFGPWGVVIVRVVDFPNAGFRSFRWDLAIGMTMIGIFLVLLGVWMKQRYLQYGWIVVWVIFTVIWFGVGLIQIADGLL